MKFDKMGVGSLVGTSTCNDVILYHTNRCNKSEQKLGVGYIKRRRCSKSFLKLSINLQILSGKSLRTTLQ